MNSPTQKIASNTIASATMPNCAEPRMQGGLDKRSMLSKAHAASYNCAQVRRNKKVENFDFAGIAG